MVTEPLVWDASACPTGGRETLCHRLDHVVGPARRRRRTCTRRRGDQRPAVRCVVARRSDAPAATNDPSDPRPRRQRRTGRTGSRQRAVRHPVAAHGSPVSSAVAIHQGASDGESRARASCDRPRRRATRRATGITNDRGPRKKWSSVWSTSRRGRPRRTAESMEAANRRREILARARSTIVRVADVTLSDPSVTTSNGRVRLVECTGPIAVALRCPRGDGELHAAVERPIESVQAGGRFVADASGRTERAAQP